METVNVMGWEWAREYVNGDGIREWRRLWVGVGKGVYVNGDGYGWERG